MHNGNTVRHVHVAWIHVVLLYLVALSTVRGSMVCQHRDDVEHAVHGVYLEPHNHIAKRAASQPARFSVFYDSSITQLSTSAQNRVKTIMPQLTTFLSQTLQVKPLGVPILLDQQCATSLIYIIKGLHYCSTTCAATTMCGQAKVPASHLQVCRQCNGLISSCNQTGTNGTGISNTDYIFYVSAVNTSCGANVLAFASYCQTESSLDRPIAGNINFCPLAFSSSVYNYIMSVVQHEALHALGFSSGLFSLWRDQNGNPRTPRNPITNLPPGFQPSNTTVMALNYTNWVVRTGTISHPVTLLVTPNVLAAAKLYFNCSNLIGVELENQGGAGTAGSHWEKRILGNELMTGEVTFNLKFSVLTLAALQDTGWYQVNYSMAQPLVWGQNAGCLFAAGSCGGYITSKLALGGSIDPFCNHNSAGGINLLGCTIDRAALSYCNLVQYPSALPPDYQYFSSLGSYFGGGDVLADYCPFQDYVGYNGVCSNVTNNPSGINSRGETYGPGSACVLQGSVGWSVATSSGIYTPHTPGAGCYKYSYINNSISIGVLGTSFPCITVNQQINVRATVNGSRYIGSLLCATFNQLSGGGVSGGGGGGGGSNITQSISSCSKYNGSCLQICTNTTVGSILCSCMIGYKLGADSNTCNDIDECSTNNGGCPQVCINTIGSYICSTDNLSDGDVSGGGGGSDITQSISSCSKYNGNCSQICTNTTMGSILCSCMIGYKLGADNNTCNDIDECSTNNGGCPQLCINTIGSYICSNNADILTQSGGQMTGIIIGSVVAATIIVVIAICLLVLLQRRLKKITQGTTEMMEPIVIDNTNIQYVAWDLQTPSQ